MIIIELTNEDAELFKSFREHQDVFKALMDAGLDSTKNGKLILNYNHLGEMLDIEKSVHIRVALQNK
jgi:hypothetical protein